MYPSAKANGFSLRGLGRENFGGHYSPLTLDSPLPDVERRVDVGVCGMPAADALEGGLVETIALVDTPARPALAGRIAGIDKGNRNAGAFRLVGDEISELGESPITKSRSLAAAGRYPAADTLQFFQGDAATGAFSIRYERLRNHMICVLLEPRLLAGEFTETALGRLGATLLKPLAPACQTIADAFNVGAGVDSAITIDGQGNDTKIDAEPILGVELGRLGDVAGSGEIPFAANLAEIDLTFPESKQPTLMFSHHYWDGDTAVKRQDACGGSVFYKAEDAIVIGLGAILTEDWRNFAVDFEGIGDLGDRPNGHLRGKTEARPNVRVGHLVQIELPKDRSVIPNTRKPCRRLVTTGERFRQCKRLRLRRDQFHGGNQLHALKYRYYAMPSQECRASHAPLSIRQLKQTVSRGVNR
jgi:hypothetical protein